MSNSAFLPCAPSVAENSDLFRRLPDIRRDEPTVVKHILGPLLSALASLHIAGYIHRDIKPENIMLQVQHAARMLHPRFSGCAHFAHEVARSDSRAAGETQTRAGLPARSHSRPSSRPHWPYTLLCAHRLHPHSHPHSRTHSHPHPHCHPHSNPHSHSHPHRPTLPPSPQGSHALLADFGFAICHRRRRALTRLGTLQFMAPEVVLNDPHDKATHRDAVPRGVRLPYSETVDVWALGVVAFECMTGALPFTGTTEDDVVDAVLRTRPQYPGTLR